MVPRSSKTRSEMLCALHVRRDFQIVCAYMVRLLIYRNAAFTSVLSVMKGCSHVTCKTCTDTLVRPGKQCVVCDKLLAEGDILELKREGWSLLPTHSYHLSQRVFQAPVTLVAAWLRLGNKVSLFRDRCSRFNGVTQFL
jgi:hypothetical protein